MARHLWLHIGAPKTGTTALQHAFSTCRDALADCGLTYASPEGKSAANGLAVALNRNRTDAINRLSAELVDQVKAAAGDALISSEMFYGMTPAILSRGLPIIAPETTTLLVWIKRQDLYLESKYLQKVKNGRFDGSIWDFIDRFDGSGADFDEMLQPWSEAGYQIKLHLPGEDVVTQALGSIGLANKVDLPPMDERENRAPSTLRLQLLHAAAAAGHPDQRRLQRRLPPDPLPRARLFSLEERHRIMDRYAASNERLRTRHFPERPTLFDPIVDEEADGTSSEALSDVQMKAVTDLLRTFKATLG